ncbi:MAG: PIN domain-containing protein [Thiohalocapsa sp.]
MYLVDTSVWINFFKAIPNPAVERLKTLLRTGVDIGICTTILQEILQGTADPQQFAKYRRYFETQPIYLPPDPVKAAIAAAQMYHSCCRQGITVRSSNDCLIAHVAMDNGLILLHDDEDFRRIRNVVTELKETSN